MAGIYLLYPRFMQGLDRVLPPRKAKKKESVKRFLYGFVKRAKQALAVSLSAQFGVLLPIAAYYHHVYPYSLPFNLAIVPMVGVLVPLYAVTALVHLSHGLADGSARYSAWHPALAAKSCCGWFDCQTRSRSRSASRSPMPGFMPHVCLRVIVSHFCALPFAGAAGIAAVIAVAIAG
jgi:predicted membrane metal-binding protein